MRGVVGAAMVALATTIGGMGCKDTAPPRADGGVADEPGQTGQTGQVLARVGERTITLGDYAAALEHLDQFDRVRYEAPQRRKELLGEIIDVMLLAAAERTRGYDKDHVTQQR